MKWSSVGALVCFSLNQVPAATLTGSFSSIAAGSNVNLTLGGKLDWVHWGLYTDTSVNRKGCANSQIGNFTPVLATNDPNGFVQAYQFSDNANGYTWSDGSPVISVTNTTTGVWAYGVPNLGTGFEFSVPADTTPRTLQVFVGVFSGGGTFQASLSDNSAPAYTNDSLANLSGNGPGGVYTLNYAATVAGQSLKIRWTLSQALGPNRASANVTLQAATLTAPGANNPPFVTLTDPAPNATFSEPATIMLNASAQDFDGSVTNVAFYADTNLLGQVTAGPFNFTWDNVARGHYTLAAYATDNAGATSCALPVEIFVYGTGGGQTNSVASSPAAVDLTSEGTADWTHWGLATKSSFDSKDLAQRKITNYSPIGTAVAQRYADNYTSFSWSDGTPTPATNGTTTGLFVTGIGNGFRLTAPADTHPQTLRVYVGGYGVEGEFQAYLSDLSAKPYTDTSVSNVYDNSSVMYTINYTAASAGQQLNVVYRSLNLFDLTYGNVTLQSATLQGETISAGQLAVTPAGDLSASGTVGGLFSPSSIIYALTNSGGSTLNWTASKSQDWVSLSATGGNLTAGASTTVTVSINGNADSLTAGSYSDTVNFLNTTTGSGNTNRSVSLTVNSAGQFALYLTNATRLGDDFVLSFNTQTGQDYTVEYTASLPPVAWSNLLTVPGNGALVTVTNYSAPAGERYYRVRTP